jgi:4-amino-4-deoxy-L-arabinose transferase-like glycosyltransferase
MISARHRLFLLLILLAGIALRVVDFPRVPAGLNQDEASSAYEAYSLALTGADRWGNRLPPYFPGWGSGQNVLLSYILVPFVRWFGLSVFSTRLVPLLLGILTLPLVAFGLRQLGRRTAMLGTLMVAIMPWHFMLSRWALESNLAPFFMLLGCVCTARALITGRPRWIIPCLLPFALALYAYGTTAIVLPLMGLLLLLLHRRTIAAQGSAWLLALLLFGIASFPFGIFFIENYVLHHDIAWARHLPFDTPLLPFNRLGQVGGDSGTSTLIRNLAFMANGFDDGTCYNKMPGYPLLLLPVLPLGLMGIVAGSILLFRRGTQRASLPTPDQITLSMYLSWAIATLPLLSLFTQNVNRFNHFYLPIILLAAWAANGLIEHLGARGPKRLTTGILLAALLAEGGLAAGQYFTDYDEGPIRKQFNAGLEDAFTQVQQLPEAQIRITASIPLPYVYTLFFTSYPPGEFQREAIYTITDGSFDVARFGRYVFHDDLLQAGQSFGYLISKGEQLPGNGSRHVTWNNDNWEVGTAVIPTASGNDRNNRTQ